jgi:hypothetical protein
MKKKRSVALLKASKNQMPPWYPIETYSRKLSRGEWATELYIRVATRIAIENASRRAAAERKSSITMANGATPVETFLAVLVDQAAGRKGTFIFEEKVNYRRDWPIRSPSGFEMEFIASMLRPHTPSRLVRWARLLAKDRKQLGKFIAASERKKVDVYDSQGWAGWDTLSPDEGILHRDVLGPRVPLMVNLCMDDESLKTAFDFWLSTMRNELGDKSKKEYSDDDFGKWREFKILQVFDLDLWKEISGASYTDAFVARQLWPETDPSLGHFDRTDRLRRVSRKLVAERMNVWACERLVHETRLWNLMEAHKAELEAERAGGSS